MIKLNDYLYSGDTVIKILRQFTGDLREHAISTGNSIDMAHCNFLLQLTEVLEHNDFLTDQSERIHEVYSYLGEKYPDLSFTFKGRIKSLIRAEEKFNGYVVRYIHDYYVKHGEMPSELEIRNKVSHFRDLLAYRFIISIPKCHLEPGKDKEEEELRILYEIANDLPGFFEQRGFTAELAGKTAAGNNDRLKSKVKRFFKDYIEHPNAAGYKSLHITFYDNIARSYFEVQLRTKEMDDYAEIGPANHFGYEKRQEQERSNRDDIPEGKCLFFDEACERGVALQQLKLNEVDVNMFSAINNQLVNDCCGLLYGRLILPCEHLSRFQND